MKRILLLFCLLIALLLSSCAMQAKPEQADTSPISESAFDSQIDSQIDSQSTGGTADPVSTPTEGGSDPSDASLSPKKPIMTDEIRQGAYEWVRMPREYYYNHDNFYLGYPLVIEFPEDYFAGDIYFQARLFGHGSLALQDQLSAASPSGDRHLSLENHDLCVWLGWLDMPKEESYVLIEIRGFLKDPKKEKEDSLLSQAFVLITKTEPGGDYPPVFLGAVLYSHIFTGYNDEEKTPEEIESKAQKAFDLCTSWFPEAPAK